MDAPAADAQRRCIFVTVRVSLKSFTASSILSRAEGLGPDSGFGSRLGNPLSLPLEHLLALELGEGAARTWPRDGESKRHLMRRRLRVLRDDERKLEILDLLPRRSRGRQSRFAVQRVADAAHPAHNCHDGAQRGPSLSDAKEHQASERREAPPSIRAPIPIVRVPRAALTLAWCHTSVRWSARARRLGRTPDLAATTRWMRTG